MERVEPELAVWRHKRWFMRLHDRYERRGDQLIQFGEIVDWLTSAELSRSAITQRFLFSARNGGFGFRPYGCGPRQRRAVERLIDLDSYSSFTPGCYVLRPSTLTVEMNPHLMRAPRSVWVQWLQAQEWPVPPELGNSLVIEADYVEVPDRQLTVGASQAACQTTADLEKAHADHVKAWREEHGGRYPSRKETHAHFGGRVTYERIGELRPADLPQEVRRGGRPRKNLDKKPV
jgi:hypothetical protein